MVPAKVAALGEAEWAGYMQPEDFRPDAQISHELRTPMGAVISMSELLLTSPLDGMQRRYAETLQQSARSLLTVLNDILDFSKLEAGRFQLEYPTFDLHDLVKSAGSALQARADEKTLQSGVHIGTSCPRFVKGDAGRLRQILANLVNNAVKFTQEGSVHLHVNARESDDKLTLRFDVTDTGIGLSEDQKERLFQPYVQADRAMASQYGGTGLGLSIARRLVELMGGEIGCESMPGQGSLFWFTIPAERAMPAAYQDPQSPGTLSGHVLVVEDNAVNRMLIGAYLDEFGLTYEIVEGGANSITRLTAKAYDLVLVDIRSRRRRDDQAHSQDARRRRRGADRRADRPCDEGRSRNLSRRGHGWLCLQAHPRARALGGACPLFIARGRTGSSQTNSSWRRSPGQPRVSCELSKSWMAGPSPAIPVLVMTASALEIVHQHAGDQDQIGDQQKP